MQGLSNQRLDHILAYSPAIIYTVKVNQPFNLTFISENFSTQFGYSTQECLDNPEFWRRNIHPDDCDCVFDDHDSLRDTGHHVHEFRLRNRAGDYVWILDELRLRRDSEGQPVEIVGSWLDISERKATEAALVESEKLFRDFFQTNPVATIITDPFGTVHMVNPAFTEHTDYSAEEVVGRTSQELGFWRNPDDRERMLAAIKEHGFINNLESSFYGKQNRPMTCLVSSRAVEFGGETRLLSVVHDVTEQRAAEEALRKLDQAKSDFISTAAHELRTPLIAIVGYAELLENAAETALSEEQKEDYISIIQSNAEFLSHLIDDLLDVGRIQVGRSLGVVLNDTDLSALIRKIVESVVRESALHEVLIDHTNALPETVHVDSTRITQVFNNLLHNAIKYSPDGGTIKVQTVTDVDKVTVSIVDQGIGMTPQQVEKVFDRFYRVSDASHETGGFGLGMGIVKHIIESHGGEVFVSSTIGDGTTVTFTLPVKPPV